MPDHMTFEEFARDKLILWKLPSYYGPKGPTEQEIGRVEGLEKLLEEYEEKKRLGMLLNV